jgi:thiamine biosynthesis lipoprotein
MSSVESVAPAVTRQQWRAMGADAHVVVVGDPGGLAELARDTVARLERCWSRFLPASDVTRINLAAGRPTTVDPTTLDLLEHAAAGWTATGGAFDPTQLAPLVAAGYDVSWDDPTRRTFLPEDAFDRADPRMIRLDRSTSTVTAPVGTTVDPGGIGKGMAADLTVAALLDAGAAGALVSLGGDLSVGGTPPDGTGWRIDVREAAPIGGPIRSTQQLHLRAGGVATSGTSRHAWRHADGASVHHVLDPATGRPTAGILEATVVAGSGAWAEIWATALVVAGPARTLPALEAAGFAAAWTDGDGTRRHSARWHEFTGDAPSPTHSTGHEPGHEETR